MMCMRAEKCLKHFRNIFIEWKKIKTVVPKEKILVIWKFFAFLARRYFSNSL